MKSLLFKLFPLIVCHLLVAVDGLSQIDLILTDSSIQNNKLGDSIKHAHNIKPLNKLEFRAFPSERFYFSVDTPLINKGTNHIKIDALILSISEDSCINNIFAYLFDSSNVVETFLVSKKYKAGWSTATTNIQISTWITPANTIITVNKMKPSTASFLGNYYAIRITKITDRVAISDYYILPRIH